MDKPLEIPDAAIYAAAQAASIDLKIYSTAPIEAALHGAAPLIVAAAYRARARECNCLHDTELLNCAADELER
jgi:hypothetical protein